MAERVWTGVMTTTPDDLAARLAALDSTVVSDALDGLGLPPGVGELIARWGARALSGRVRTVELEPDRGGAPGPHIATSVIASARPGEVLVVANGGRTDVSCWGGILSLGSVLHGVVGVVAGRCLPRRRRGGAARPPRLRPRGQPPHRPRAAPSAERRPPGQHRGRPRRRGRPGGRRRLRGRVRPRTGRPT